MKIVYRNYEQLLKKLSEAEILYIYEDVYDRLPPRAKSKEWSYEAELKAVRKLKEDARLNKIAPPNSIRPTPTGIDLAKELRKKRKTDRRPKIKLLDP